MNSFDDGQRFTARLLLTFPETGFEGVVFRCFQSRMRLPDLLAKCEEFVSMIGRRLRVLRLPRGL